MKKLVSLALALIMIFSLATVAFATTSNTPPTDPRDDTAYNGRYDKAGIVSKKYEVINGKAPAEDFLFTFEGLGFKGPDDEEFWLPEGGIPEIADVTLSFEESIVTKYVSETFDWYVTDITPLGEYKYKVTEVDNKTAGVTYNNKPLYVIITVFRDEENGRHYVAAVHYETEDGGKFEYVTNTYDSGALRVRKLIDGNMATMTDEFEFTVTFTVPSDKVLRSEIGVRVAGNVVANPDIVKDGNQYSYTFNLGHDETAEFTNIPAGVTYTVTENTTAVNSDRVYTHDATKDEKYEDTVSGDADRYISGGDAENVTFTNHKEAGVDTGIILDSAPYILLLVVAFMGMGAMLTKKRHG